MAGMSDPAFNASAVAKRLGITRTTLYEYVNGDDTVKEPGQKLLAKNGALQLQEPQSSENIVL